MAIDKKISELASGAPAQAADEYVVARGAANYKLTLTNIAASMPPIGATTPNTASFTTLTTSSTVTLNGGTANGVLYLNGSKVATSGSALVFDGTNLGLGVTPSAWGSQFKALEAADADSQSFISFNTNANAVRIGTNNYFNGTNTLYKFTGTAGQFVLNGNAFEWQQAASGTAGNTISFTQAMTLDASGNLGIGTTSPNLSSVTRALTISSGTSASTTSAIELLGNTNATDAALGAIRFYNTNSSNVQVASIAGRTDSASNSGYIQFATASSGTLAERGRFDSSGSLLLGTTTNPTTGVVARSVLSIKQLNDTSFSSGIQLEANADTSFLGIGYNGTSFQIGTSYRSTGGYKPIVFVPGNTTTLTLTTSGTAQFANSISVGGATPTTSGAGVTFPATQSASSNANTLDDYEEGTFNLTLGGSGGESGQSYTARTGYYTKIGNQVTVSGYVELASGGTGTVTGDAQLKGFPFTPQSAVTAQIYWNRTNINFTEVYLYGYQSTTFSFKGMTAAGTGNSTNLTAADLYGNQFQMLFSLCYTV